MLRRRINMQVQPRLFRTLVSWDVELGMVWSRSTVEEAYVTGNLGPLLCFYWVVEGNRREKLDAK